MICPSGCFHRACNAKWRLRSSEAARSRCIGQPQADCGGQVSAAQPTWAPARTAAPITPHQGATRRPYGLALPARRGRSRLPRNRERKLYQAAPGGRSAGSLHFCTLTEDVRLPRAMRTSRGRWAFRKSSRPQASFALLLHQRAIAGFERLGRVFRRDGGDQLVVVPGIFRLFRLFHLEQIGRNDAAAVGAQRALAEQRIVSRDFPSSWRRPWRRHADCRQGFHRLQVMAHHGVVAGLCHRRHRILGGESREPLSTRHGSGHSCPGKTIP